MILCGNPRAQFLAHREEIQQAFLHVLESGRYILGPEVESFEHEFAAYCGASCGVTVASGTDALQLALRACGIGRGDEVITVSHTAVATVSAIELTGAMPVLVDVNPRYFTIEPSRVAACIGPRTKAIIPVHLYGQPADLEPIMELARRHDLRVIEDCAQAHGAIYRGRRVGTWGEMGCFSFYPTKNLGALGDGGMVVTNNVDLAARLRQLREYGWNEKRESQIPGLNTRLDELQAAVLRVKLRYLDQDNAARCRCADLYDRGLSGTECERPQRRPDSTHVFHLYVIRSRRRDALRQYLEHHGVRVLVHYPLAVHQQAAYRGRLTCADLLSETESAVREILSLPLYPELTDGEILRVIELIQRFSKSAPERPQSHA
jgi:dTDP-4-amino-4,6-dideoxygalactose transaminase